MENKLLNTMSIFDSYERRFARVRAEKQEVFSTEQEHRFEILSNVKRMLGIKDELVPTVHDWTVLDVKNYDGYSVSTIRYQTWENCYVSATLTLPDGEEKVPLICAVNGHNKNSRHADGLRLMHHRLAKMGIATVTPDNIGQGDRAFMGHTYAYEPFYHGLTLQGLIVMETLSLIRYMKKHPRIDSEKIGAAGNSGGGTLTLFLAALAPELSAICSSGYPSEFGYILSKERRHCACNLLPGCAGKVDMWEIYSLFAPKPLLLEQGLFDDLIPVDLFYRNNRKVRTIYSLYEKEENFKEYVSSTRHPWDREDRKTIASFFAEVFGVEMKEFEEKEFVLDEPVVVEFSEDALNTKSIAEKLSGNKTPDGIMLEDIFPPKIEAGCEDFTKDIGRGDLVRVFAQMECALSKEW